MSNKSLRVGVLGATSLVGRALLPVLAGANRDVVAYSRKAHPSASMPNVQWRALPPAGTGDQGSLRPATDNIPYWICAAPIWVLPDYFPMLEEHGAKRVVALSSTSRFTKRDSASDEEKVTAFNLSDAETRLEQWAEQRGINWIILRPTLIYGFGQDKNISELVPLIRRFRFFPLAGESKGLRQPVHADDVAAACLAALEKLDVANRAYNLSGGETLTYREMISTIFTSLGLRPRLLVVPLKLLYVLQTFLRLFPRYQRWNTAMVARMNTDLVFDHSEAARDLNFTPRKFQLTLQDLPRK